MHSRLLVVLCVVQLAASGCRSAEAPEAATGRNADIVRGVYESFARGDVPAALAALDSSVQWNEAEGYPYADRNPYVGPQAVAEGVFQRVTGAVDGFAAVPENFIEGGSTVVVEGRYKGTVKASGRPVDAQFVHLWKLRDDKVIDFQQYTDTRQWADAGLR